MEVIIQTSDTAASELAARRVAALVRGNPEAVLGLATGNSPVGFYAELVRMHRDEGLDLLAGDDLQPRRVCGPRARASRLVPALHAATLFRSCERPGSKHSRPRRVGG